jgi:hypothetical protein
MTQRRKSKVNAKGRNSNSDRFMRLPQSVAKSEAYRSLSAAARSLLVELAMLENGQNNGSLYLSVRDAADRLGMADHRSVSIAFDDLVDRGLIRCTKEAHFGIKASEQSRARCWRLTWVPANNRPATRDWEGYSAPAKSTERKRADRGLRALKKHQRALTSHRLPVVDSRATERSCLPNPSQPVVVSTAAIDQNQAIPPNSVALDSNAHTAVTITVPKSDWWKQRSYLRLPDPYVLRANNDC